MLKTLFAALILMTLSNFAVPAHAGQDRVAVGVSLQIVDACAVQAGSDGDVKIKCRSSSVAADTSPSHSRISPAQVSELWCRSDHPQATSDGDRPTCLLSRDPGFDQQLVMITF